MAAIWYVHNVHKQLIITYSLQSLFSKVKAGSKVVSVHDGFQMVHGSHAVGKINVCTVTRVAEEIHKNRGKELTNTPSAHVWGETRQSLISAHTTIGTGSL